LCSENAGWHIGVLSERVVGHLTGIDVAPDPRIGLRWSRLAPACHESHDAVDRVPRVTASSTVRELTVAVSIEPLHTIGTEAMTEVNG
jgi:hypothetical protein